MYLGVDVGGSKTLVGIINRDGTIKQQEKFPTPVKYTDFLTKLAQTVDKLSTNEFDAVAAGVPATRLDRVHGVGRSFGNLPWKNALIKDDLEGLFDCPAAVENDAKLACLSESTLRPSYSKVLYVTISTGIGYALCKDRQIDTSIGDGGGKLLLLPHKGRLEPWESFASGKAIVERFGKKASDITDTHIWQRIAFDLAGGFWQLIAITEPDVIVVGGSVGNYFERLKPHLEVELKRYHTPLLPIPPIEKASRPEEAVLFGCYNLIKAVYGRDRQHSKR